MYQDYITSQNEAICHLFLHCCFKDGVFSKDEIDSVASNFVGLQIHRDMNFKEEVQHYKTYIQDVTDETAYLQYIFKLINAVQEFALYSYCVELCLSDKSLSTSEESLLAKIAGELKIDLNDKNVIDTLAVQRKAVETEKIF